MTLFGKANIRCLRDRPKHVHYFTQDSTDLAESMKPLREILGLKSVAAVQHKYLWIRSILGAKAKHVSASWRWSAEVCWYTWTRCNHPLSTLLSVWGPNLILIHRGVNSCSGQAVHESPYGHVRSITPSVYRRPWITGIYFLLIRVATVTFHQCRLPPDQWGVMKEELTTPNVLQCLSCIITHLKIDRSHLKKEIRCHASTVPGGALRPLSDCAVGCGFNSNGISKGLVLTTPKWNQLNSAPSFSISATGLIATDYEPNGKTQSLPSLYVISTFSLNSCSCWRVWLFVSPKGSQEGTKTKSSPLRGNN